MIFCVVDDWILDVNGPSVFYLSNLHLCCTYLLSICLDQAVFIVDALLCLAYVCLEPIQL